MSKIYLLLMITFTHLSSSYYSSFILCFYYYYKMIFTNEIIFQELKFLHY